MERVAFVIPTLNEASSIGNVLDRIPSGELRKEGYDTSVYVIDGLSVDNTRDIAAEKGAQLVLEKRKGNGAALKKAFKSVTADYVLVSDGDNTYPLDVAPEMLRLLQTNEVVVGLRLKGSIEPGAMTRLNVFGNTLLTLLARLLVNSKISGLCTGFWGYRGHVIQNLKLSAEGFAIEADVFAESADKGFDITEIPITNGARGESCAKLSSLRDGVRIAAFCLGNGIRADPPELPDMVQNAPKGGNTRELTMPHTRRPIVVSFRLLSYVRMQGSGDCCGS